MIKLLQTVLIVLSLYSLANAKPFLNNQKLLENTGRDFFEGDIKLKSNLNHKSLASAETSNLWDNGVLPYIIDNVYSQSQKDLIKSAMDLISSKTGVIKFVPRTTEQNYVHFKKLDGCWSYIGNTKSGMQEISLAFSTESTCLVKGTIVHEICHALGFYHEQNRPDRDQYVTIDFNNIAEAMKSNFELYKGLTYNTPYDFKSVMHYTEYAFSKNGLKTIIPKDSNIVIKSSSQRTDDEILSTYDIDAIRARYNVTLITTTSTTTTTNTNNNTTNNNCTDRVDNCGLYFHSKDLYCDSNRNYLLNGMSFRQACEKMCGICTVPANTCQDSYSCQSFYTNKDEYCHNKYITYYLNDKPMKEICPKMCQACSVKTIKIATKRPNLLRAF